jgi:hypothetical protein
VKNSSPRVFFFALGEEILRREFFLHREYFFYSRQRDLRRELEIKLSPKNIALGEDSVSRSDARNTRDPVLRHIGTPTHSPHSPAKLNPEIQKDAQDDGSEGEAPLD